MYRDYINKSLYAEDVEVSAIDNAIQPEFDRQLITIDFDFRQQWIMLADEIGIDHWERILSIVPDLANDDLEFRRARVHRIYNMRTPFTLGWLVRWLHEEYNVQNIRMAWSPIKLYLELWILAEDLRIAIEIRRQVIQIIPANINLQLLRQLPFPPVEPAVTSLFTVTHKMAVHRSKGYAFPQMPVEPAVVGLFAGTNKMSVHRSKALAIPYDYRRRVRAIISVESHGIEDAYIKKDDLTVKEGEIEIG